MKFFKGIVLLLFIGIYASCNNDDDMNSPILIGVYTETIPYSGTHQLNFVDNNSLILKARNSTDQKFTTNCDF